MGSPIQPRWPTHAPLTFGGVATLAKAGNRRLGWWALATAAAVGFCAVVFCRMAWLPAVEVALQRLPEGTRLLDGRFHWPGPELVELANTESLAIEVRLSEQGATDQSAALRFELGEASWRLHSLLGYLEGGYPAWLRLDLSPDAVGPWWGAWRPVVLAGVGFVAGLSAMTSWGVLSALWAGPVRVWAFCLDRSIGLSGCWRLAFAAHLPGAWFAAIGLVLNGFHRVGSIGLLVLWLLQFVVVWVYLAGSPFALDRFGTSPDRSGNPFAAVDEPRV